MRKKIVISLSLVAIMSAGPTTVFAMDTPSPQSSRPAAHSKQALTQAQKDAVRAARSVFAAAKTGARNGFDRALADAKAVRDQAVAGAGTDQNSIRAAKKNFRNSYKTIYCAYIEDLKKAKSTFQSAIAVAIGSNKTH